MALLQSFTAFFMSMVLVTARDAGKVMRTVPSITNSLVNLGKMDISIHINGPPEGFASAHNGQNTLFFPPKEVEHSCACSDFKPLSPFLSNPTEILNKILKSNDLFKDPTSSACCGSHEHDQEKNVFIELLPNPNKKVQRSHLSPQIINFPHFEKLFQSPSKSKQVEILLFPKRKDMITFEYPSFTPKKKGTKPDFKLIEEKNTQSASVKKDLTLSAKIDEMRDEALQTVTPANLITNNNLLS